MKIFLTHSHSSPVHRSPFPCTVNYTSFKCMMSCGPYMGGGSKVYCIPVIYVIWLLRNVLVLTAGMFKWLIDLLGLWEDPLLTKHVFWINRISFMSKSKKKDLNSNEVLLAWVQMKILTKVPVFSCMYCFAWSICDLVLNSISLLQCH